MKWKALSTLGLAIVAASCAPDQQLPTGPGEKTLGPLFSMSGSPIVSLGHDFAATMYGGVRYRSFGNTGGAEVFEGTKLGSGTVGVNYVVQNLTWGANNTISFTYDPATQTLTSVVNGGTPLVFSGFQPASAINYMKIQVAEQNAGSTVDFNNVSIDGTSIGNFSPPCGAALLCDWKLVGANFSGGFTLTGDIVLTGTQGTSQENNKVEITLGYLASPNTPPTANPGGPYLGAINTAIAFDGSFSSDPDSDALTYAWDFGDGSTGSNASPTHTYTEAGIYDVCLTVNDGTVDSDPACTVAVVYDPTAGFVTGGGWFTSPAGAYVDGPLLTGKATFGFVSKYVKGKTLPTGNTQFQFKAGDLTFSSSSYEWLVVSGARAQFKGAGTINGSGDYRFMLTVIDGQVTGGGGIDKFRIRIWNNDGGALVYDNQPSAPDSATPSTTIDGGSIMIHVPKK